MSQTRMPAIPEDQYTEAQHKAAQEFLATRQTPVFGPFIPLIRSPELMLRVKEMGDYLRFKNSLGPMLSEFTILIMAREWSQDYEWYVHHPLAMKAGLKPEIAEAIFEGRRPDGMAADEEAVYDFVTELNHSKRQRRHLRAGSAPGGRAGRYRSCRPAGLLHADRHDLERVTLRAAGRCAPVPAHPRMISQPLVPFEGWW